MSAVRNGETVLVFITKDGPSKQYPAALDRFKKVIDRQPGTSSDRQRRTSLAELLFAGRIIPGA